MGSQFDKFKKGLRDLFQAQQLKSELGKVEERREQALQRLGERNFYLIEEGRLQPHPDTKDAYLDVRALDDRVRHLKELIAQGHVGPIPAPPERRKESDLEARPAALDEGPLGAEEAAPAPPEVRASLGACVCGAVIPKGAKYCTRCGMPAEAGAADLKKTIAPPRKCPHCGTEVPLGSDFCPECGGHADQEVYEV